MADDHGGVGAMEIADNGSHSLSHYLKNSYARRSVHAGFRASEAGPPAPRERAGLATRVRFSRA